MSHELYDGSGNMDNPWVMDRTAVCGPHGPWTVQWYTDPMGNGLYSSICAHGSWTVQ